MRLIAVCLASLIGCAADPQTGPQGPQGEQGAMGAMGTAGQSVTMTNEAPGANCFAGGVKITAGSTSSYICNGTDGTSATVPTGTVVAFAGGTTPTGWILCDGSAVSRTTYASLFSVIGTRHGSGDGSTTFNLPDYRGRFLRGTDGGTGRDPDAASRVAANAGGNTGDAVGSVEGSQYASHSHTINDPGHDHDMTFARDYNTTGPTRYVQYPGGQLNVNTHTLPSTTGITINASGGAETRPINAGVNFIIKL